MTADGYTPEMEARLARAVTAVRDAIKVVEAAGNCDHALRELEEDVLYYLEFRPPAS